MNRTLRGVIFILFGLVALSGTARSATFEIPDHPWVKRHLNFWIRVYTEVPASRGLIHDALHVDKVYETIDLGGLTARDQARRIRSAKSHWRKVLMEVHRKRNHPEKMSADEQRVFQMYSDIDRPNRFIEAHQKKRMRFQLGMKERFLEALHDSAAYLPHMEEIFAKEDVPVELTRLPFVESSFNFRAFSKVGASGVWQFIRSTGKRYLRMDRAVDERRDPILATEAAAKLLRENYEALGSWYLAVTAYNHGRKGMMRAVRKMGTQDFTTILEGYSHPSFGFASRNFLMEFLAAVEVSRSASHYFGDFKTSPKLQFKEEKLPDSIFVRDLIKSGKADESTLRRLNPAILDDAWKNRVKLPAGFRLKLPAD